MRRSFSRLGLFAFLTLALAVLLSHPRPTAAWQARQVPLPGVVPAKGEEPKTEAHSQFTFPEDRDAKQRLKAVMDYMEKKNVPWDVVCDTADKLLGAKSDSFYPVEAADKKGGNRISIKTKINDLIGNFPKEGREFYELTYGGTADTRLKEAISGGYDKAQLAEISQRYFHTRAGAQATLLLAVINLESGNYPEAAYGFQRLLDRPDADELLSPRTLFRAALAFKRSGDARQADAVNQLMGRLEKKFPRDGLAIGRRTYSIDELRKELDRPAELTGRVGDGLVTQRYGNASHTGVANGGTPFLDPAFTVPLLYNLDGNMKDGADWISENLTRALTTLDRSKGQVGIPGFFPVTAPNMILYRTYDGVYAVATRDGHTPQGHPIQAGKMIWMSPTMGGLQKLMSEEDRQQVQSWWGVWASRQPSILFENAQVGSLSHDGQSVYFIDDLALPPPVPTFNPNMGFPQPVQPTGATGAVRGMGDFSQLVAVNLETGKREWSLGGAAGTPLTEEEEQKTTNTTRLTEGALFLGPPLPVNGKLYFLFERNNQVRLACVDPSRIVVEPREGSRPDKYPELVWMQNLGSPNTRLNQDPNRRIQPAYLAYADGVLVCPTNSGAVVAVDVNARSLLWARYYGTVTDPTMMPGGPGMGGMRVRPGFQPPGGMPNQGVPTDRWRAAAPIIANGKVVFASYDADQLMCLDLRTGDMLWADNRRPDDLYVGGVVDDKVVVVGKESVRAYGLTGNPDQKPNVAWQNLKIGTPCGHGVAGKDGLYYIPMVGDPDTKDSKEPQIWAIDVSAGRVRPKTTFRRKDGGPDDPRLALGNLLFHDGQLFAQSALQVTAFPLTEIKKQEMARRLKENPHDPRGLTDRGELLLDDGQYLDAVRDFKEAQKYNPPEDVQRTIRQKLYVAYTELLRDNFDKGEPFLAEYEALCEVPIDTDDPNEKKRLMEENIRRRGLFLSLKAKGREKQGRLVDAFDAYREYAVLGGNKELVPDPDQANSLILPQVWARGRIDAMIRGAKDPSVRKPLEDRVLKDWEAVRSANDLNRLREFVTVFGPYFEVGRQGQLLLAERLLETNNDEDMREAQTQLMQLWATAESPPLAARAVETLARVMTRRGMLEDAVGLYSQLGSRYGDVVVKDGKTGADIYGELITDKRLLPYLDPGRGPTSMKYKVEETRGATSRPLVQTFALVPEGELFPFFRRFLLTMEWNQGAGGQQWALRVTDRATGEDRHRFTDLGTIQTQYGVNQGMPSYRLAQANGHLLLLTIGHHAYCLDLAEKRELWRYNLLGLAAPPADGQAHVEQSNDGDLLIRYSDGWVLRVGRSAVLQPTYAVLSTRDGLVALDPVTGNKLWVRTGVSPKAMVFGDAKHIFLVEGSTSRVLRAVDGNVVEGVKDFAGIINGPGRLAQLDRHILLTEGGTGSAPRVLRLFDPLTGEDTWRREFPPKAVAFETLDPELTGCISPDGTFEVLQSRTGKSLFRGALDADKVDVHLKNPSGDIVVKEPLLLADAERFYLFLNRSAGPSSRTYTMVRTVSVSGPAYGFDRMTGKRLWYTNELFENQLIFLDRFDDLPAIVAANQMTDPSTKQYVYQVSVLDKQLGRLRYHKGHPQNAYFQSVFSDPKNRTVEFWRYDLRVRIVPDEEVTKASR